MVKIRRYHLPPTKLVPNSPLPLLRYHSVLPLNRENKVEAVKAFDTFASNGWQVQWIYRYGPTQDAHYHSGTHECMAVLSGTATIRFGVADTSEEWEQNTWGENYEAGGIEVEAKVGDVFIIPAGVCHKTYDPSDESTFKLLTPYEEVNGIPIGRRASREDVKSIIEGPEYWGFCMLGAYPLGSEWDFAHNIHDAEVGGFERVWAIPRPERDPVFGTGERGICRLWKEKKGQKL